MSEFDEKLNSLLSDPDRMAQIMQMAQSLSGSMAGPETAAEEAAAPLSPPAGDLLSSLTGGLDPSLLTRMLPLLQELNSENDNGTRTLLYALRPYLKTERQDRVERALQLARLLRIGKKFFTGWEG